MDSCTLVQGAASASANLAVSGDLSWTQPLRVHEDKSKPPTHTVRLAPRTEPLFQIHKELPSLASAFLVAFPDRHFHIFIDFFPASHQNIIAPREVLLKMAQLTDNVHEMRGRTDVSHIPPMPLWVAIIRICQLVRIASARVCHFC